MKRIKKILASLMVAVMVLTAAPLSGFVGMKLNLDWLSFDFPDFDLPDFTLNASAKSYSGTCGETLTWSLDTETGELIIDGTGNMENYTSGGSPWYSRRSYIKSVSFTDELTSIGDYAFFGLTNLTCITIPNSVTAIGVSAIRNCSSLAEFTIPESVTSIGSSAFRNNTALTSIVIPDSVTDMGTSVFRDCSALESADIGDNVSTIGDYFFCGCTALTNVTIGDSVVKLGDCAFKGCASLESLTIPTGTKTIGAAAFSESDKLSLNITKDSYAETYADSNNIPYHYVVDDSVEEIISVTVSSELSFEIDTKSYTMTVNCTGALPASSSESFPWIEYKRYVKHIIINDGCTSISEKTFKDFNTIKSITIPDSVTSIGNSAFYNCTGLTELAIPISAKIYNSSYTFSGCTNIEKITLTKGNGTANGYGISNSGSATYTYYQYTPWYISGCSEVVIEDGVTGIGDHTFNGCTELTSVVIPDSVTSIGEYAFEYCGRLTSITIPDSVTRINHMAFYGCTGLTSVTIGNSVTSIGDYAFAYCAGLTSITIPDSVTGIGGAAFLDCSGLKEFTMPISAHNVFERDDTFSGWNNIEKITLTKGNGTAYNYYPHNCIYTPWYISGCSVVVIEDGVTGIGDYTFKGCTELTSVVIPDSVTSIGKNAFNSCTGLTSVTIGNGVTSIGDAAFYGCTGLTELTMPISAEIYNSSGTFYNCTNIEKITLTKGNGTVQSYSDSGSSYTKYSYTPWYISGCSEVVIEDGVTSIGDYTFHGCTGLTSVTIPDSVTSIGKQAFRNCTGLTSIMLPDRVASIGICAFYGCTGLTSVTIPDSVISIGDYAFYGCTGFTSVAIPDSVTSIGNKAFYGCTGLTSVTIPDSVTSIGEDAFSVCKNVTLYLVKGSYAETYANDNIIPYYYITDDSTEDIISEAVTSKFSFEVNTQSCTLIINCQGNMISFTAEDAPWAKYKGYIKHVIFNDGCKSIGANAFKNFCAIKTVTIPDSVTSIGDYAFYGCKGLTSVAIPDSVTSIGDYAFYGCTGLTSVTIPDSVTSIGDYAFYGCTGLTSVTIGNSVTSIGDYAFHGCAGLTSVTISDSVTSIGDYAFRGCTGLTSVTIGNSVTSIGSFAFSNCTGLTSITIPDSVTSIDYSAFNYCTGITELTMPISAKIHNSGTTFKGCTNIEKITLTKGNGTVQSYSASGSSYTNYSYTPWYISGCSEVVIEDGVTGIGNYTFYGCENIGSVTLTASVQSVGDRAFMGCVALEKLKVYNKSCTFGTEATSYYTTIVGYAGSTAEAYADENGLDFELISDDDHEHVYSNRCDNECDICGYINADAGHTFDNDCDAECNYCDFIRTPNHADDDNNGICDVCEMAISDILLGVTQSFGVKAGEIVYIKFVPANSGVYTFYSSSSSDTYGYIYDADKKQLAYNDDGGESNNFLITYTFKSGTVYYLGVKFHSSSASGEIPVTIRLDQLICDHNNTHDEHQDSTCSENGYDKVVCDDCGETVSTTELPLTDHALEKVVDNPTCEEAGAVIYYCSDCSYACVDEHLDPLGHSELVWVTVKVPSTRNEGIMNQVCPACGEVFDTKTVPAISLSADSTANIDFETNTISGFDSGSSSIGDYLSATNNGYTFTCDSEKIATGTVITLTAGEDMINEFEAVIFGDVNGDGWYDGQDAIIVDCLANGMLTKEDVGEAVYTAADCNHDGVIDQLDVDLLNQAGMLLANVDQSKPAEVLLETSAEYVEYLDLIDQSPEIEIEDETDAPEADAEETPEQDATKETNFFEMILNFIRAIIEMILSYIPMPLK